MPSDSAKVLVVGTTGDYIQWIRTSRPNGAVFLTDPAVRRVSAEPAPGPGEEIVYDLRDVEGVERELNRHLKRYHQVLYGIACFDCEAMPLTARLALAFGLPYPSPAAVANCRNKSQSKQIWRNARLSVPECRCVRSVNQALRFHKALGDECVLKPLSGTGSELVFCARNADEVSAAFTRILQGIRRQRRLNHAMPGDDDPILVEARIRGDEYSCDFIVAGDCVQLIRLTRKIPSAHGLFGTIGGYILCNAPPPGMDIARLLEMLLASARALGLQRAYCMLDFIMSGDRMVLIELAPRPGGDCLPHLMRCARGVDILSTYLDFCRQKPFNGPEAFQGDIHIGLRLHAPRGGILRRINIGPWQRDARVREIRLLRRIGERITMPPADYHSWLLGHVIFAPHDESMPEQQCRTMLDQMEVEIC